MNHYRRLLNLLLVAAGFSLAMTAAPSDADAAFRFGADGIWVPAAADTIESGSTEFDSSHQLDSFGASAHGNIGFDIFSIGLKLNYFSESLKVESESTRRKELDINAMARLGVPATKLGIFGEGGAAINTDQGGGVGYNVGLGAEYTIFSAAILDFNLGVEGQYVNFPSEVNGQSTDSKTFRFMTVVGADFGF